MNLQPAEYRYMSDALTIAPLCDMIVFGFADARKILTPSHRKSRGHHLVYLELLG